MKEEKEEEKKGQQDQEKTSNKIRKRSAVGGANIVSTKRKTPHLFHIGDESVELLFLL